MAITVDETPGGDREELEQAVLHLRPLVHAAQAELDRGDYWEGYRRETAWRDGMVNGMGGASGDLAGALPPAAVAEILRLMRAEARRSAGGGLSPHLVAFARKVNSQEEAVKETQR